MKKKLSIICLSVIFIYVIASVNNSNQCGDSFLWCDSYIAAAEGSEYSVSLTYFFKNKPVDFEKISSVTFVNATNVTVKSFEFYPMEKIKKYKSIGLELKLAFGEKASSTCKLIKIIFNNGDSKMYQIGNWQFDIGEKENSEQLLDIWNSPVASANSSEFPYLYIPSGDFSKIKIQYMINQTVDVKSSNEINGEIHLDNVAPMTIIRPRIICETNGKSIIYYGNSCYCGALDISEANIDKSFDMKSAIEFR